MRIRYLPDDQISGSSNVLRLLDVQFVEFFHYTISSFDHYFIVNSAFPPSKNENHSASTAHNVDPSWKVNHFNYVKAHPSIPCKFPGRVDPFALHVSVCEWAVLEECLKWGREIDTSQMRQPGISYLVMEGPMEEIWRQLFQLLA